jgi:hypothetical protein
MPTIIVIGAGPAGMMASISAAAEGARVKLLEKKPEIGKKLSITGKGRCNLTNAMAIEDFIAQYPVNGRFLYSSLHQFSNLDLISFFEERGVKTKVERGQRVFPVSDRAADVVGALQKCMYQYGVEVIKPCQVKELLLQDGRVSFLKTDCGVMSADAFIIATGGLSYPSTGSTGDGYRWAAQAGHNIVIPRPGLVPLETAETWVSQCQGLSLKNVQATAYNQEGRMINRECGEMLFTHFGVSGPIILTMSSEIALLLADGKQVRLVIDLKPALTAEKLDERLQRDFELYSRKQFKNALDDLLPRMLIPVVINLSAIDPHKPTHQASRAERLRLVELLKNLTLTITATRPIKEAIVTRGGVDVSQVDPRSMKSRLVENLFFCGEILDIDGYTGGFNLQAAFSTGFVAGKAAARI